MYKGANLVMLLTEVYIATEDDVKAAIALPEMKTAYLHMGDIEKRDW